MFLHYLKIQEMYNDAVSNNPAVLFLVPDHFKTEKMCSEALEIDPWSLYDIPDKAIRDDPSSLQFVPDWFVTQE